MLVDLHRRLHIRVPENLRHHLSWRATHHRLCSHRVTEVMPTTQAETEFTRCRMNVSLERIARVDLTDRMDGWTKKVWQARQYGYSWKELSSWLEITEHQAKMKFQYGLEKTRASLLRSLKAVK